jgi:hypothetical protein
MKAESAIDRLICQALKGSKAPTSQKTDRPARASKACNGKFDTVMGGARDPRIQAEFRRWCRGIVQHITFLICKIMRNTIDFAKITHCWKLSVLIKMLFPPFYFPECKRLRKQTLWLENFVIG